MWGGRQPITIEVMWKLVMVMWTSALAWMVCLVSGGLALTWASSDGMGDEAVLAAGGAGVSSAVAGGPDALGRGLKRRHGAPYTNFPL